MKPVAPKPLPRRFHQAYWDEPVIFELSQPGARGMLVPQVEASIVEQVGDVMASLPNPYAG
jgi:glycine dehydrogenase subunit 2